MTIGSRSAISIVSEQMGKRYYRADKGALVTRGQSLIQSDHYPDRLNNIAKQAEEFLRNYHDLGIARRSSIFVFEDEHEARNYYDASGDRHLYELEIDEADIVHRGDMNWINKIGEAVAAGHLEAAKAYADNWLNGVATEKPRWETLVKAAKVHSVLGKAADSPANNCLQRAIDKLNREASDDDYPFST